MRLISMPITYLLNEIIIIYTQLHIRLTLDKHLYPPLSTFIRVMSVHNCSRVSTYGWFIGISHLTFQFWWSLVNVSNEFKLYGAVKVSTVRVKRECFTVESTFFGAWRLNAIEKDIHTCRQNIGKIKLSKDDCLMVWVRQLVGSVALCQAWPQNKIHLLRTTEIF